MGRSSHSDHKERHRKHSSRDKPTSRHKDDRKRHKSSKDKKRRKEPSSALSRGDGGSHSHRHSRPSLAPHPGGDAPLGRAPPQPLDAARDYFAFHEHLWVYLHRFEGRAFNDLSAEDTRAAFERFAEAYNAGRLPQVYYQEILPSELVEDCKTTRHKWKFHTSDAEDQSLRMLSRGVKRQTDYREEGAAPPAGLEAPSVPVRSDAVAVEVHHPGVRPAEERYRDRVADRRLQAHVRTAHEELAGGRPDPGRERQLEQRRQVADRTHGAARDREQAIELGDDVIFGNDTQGFRAALQREKQRNARREEQQQKRLVELQQKEETKKQEMMKKLGIKPGQKFTIQPRNDG